jgi:hypothetical protein
MSGSGKLCPEHFQIKKNARFFLRIRPFRPGRVRGEEGAPEKAVAG